MRPFRVGLALAGIAALFLSACGGGGGGNSSSGGATNRSPTANAGVAQTVNEGVVVTLNGTASSDTDGTIASARVDADRRRRRHTVQLHGCSALVHRASGRQRHHAHLLVGRYRQSRRVEHRFHGEHHRESLVAGNVNVTGKVRFERVNFLTTGQRPLDYANPVLRPSRGVIVRALNAGTLAQIVAGVTDSNGAYTLSVPSSTNVIIEVVARMQKTGAAPTWDVRVQDGVAGTTPCTIARLRSAQASGVPQNIRHAHRHQRHWHRRRSRHATFRTLRHPRHDLSGAAGRRRRVAQRSVFQPLIIDWGTQTAGTFFSPQAVSTSRCWRI